MATIQDYSEFKIKITPRYTNWWSFRIEFFFKDKPLFNPEIIRQDFYADEYSRDPLLQKIEEALNCDTPEKKFFWGEWEEEAAITIEYQKYNSMAEDGFFVFSAFVSTWYFNEGVSNSMHQPAGLRLVIIERDVLKKFYTELNDEMLAIYNTLSKDQKSGDIGSRPK